MKEKGWLCGGIISETKFHRDLEEKGCSNMMSYVMPDKQLEKYLALSKQGKNKEANKLFEKFAYSQI